MRRHLGNRLIRARRNLRFTLADRYRALLASRFVALTSLAAAVLDYMVIMRRRVRRPRTRPTNGPTLVRGAVGGTNELSLIVRNAPPDTDGVVLRQGDDAVLLEAVFDHGIDVLRVAAALPPSAFDGDTRTISLRAGDAVVDVSPGPVRTAPGGSQWPPLLTRDQAGRLALVATAPSTAGLPHTVEAGVRSAMVTWAADGPSRLLLVSTSGAERDFVAVLEGGRAQATFDIEALADHDTTWSAFAVGEHGRAPLALPLGEFPRLGRGSRQVRLPATGATARTAEIGYSRDNQLVVRVGNLAVA